MIAITVEILCWAGIWWVISETIKSVAEVPAKTKKIEDAKKKFREMQEHYSDLLSLVHAYFTSVLCGYFLLVNPWQANRPFLDAEKMMFRVATDHPGLLRLLRHRYDQRLEVRLQRLLDEPAPLRHVQLLLVRLQP